MKLIRWLLSNIILIVVVLALSYTYVYWDNLTDDDTPAGKAFAWVSEEFEAVGGLLDYLKVSGTPVGETSEVEAVEQVASLTEETTMPTSESDVEGSTSLQAEAKDRYVTPEIEQSLSRVYSDGSQAGESAIEQTPSSGGFVPGAPVAEQVRPGSGYMPAAPIGQARPGSGYMPAAPIGQARPGDGYMPGAPPVGRVYPGTGFAPSEPFTGQVRPGSGIMPSAPTAEQTPPESNSVANVSAAEQAGPGDDLVANAPATNADNSVAGKSEGQSQASRELWINARRSFHRRDFENSISNYEQLISQTKDNFDAYGELGNVYFNQGKMKEAVSAYYEAAAILVRLGQLERASSLMGMLGHMDPDKAKELQTLISSARS